MHPRLQSLTCAPYFNTYLSHLESGTIAEALDESERAMLAVLKKCSETDLPNRYALDKWTIAQVLQHTIETEMIFNFRALTVGREDEKVVLPGFDENHFAAHATTEALKLSDWQQFFLAVRQSTKFLARTLSDQQMDKVGTASGYDIEVRALFLVSAGHTIHHCKVIKERYLN